ncbi:2TM domain-containing protein [Plantactinospora endophytica]|nr:2TM domain-containing protein [Plantactinospora endophytica]
MRSTTNGAAARWGLRIHALWYVLANVGQVFTWYYATPEQFFWPLWSIVGWGVGLAFHAWAVNRNRHRI